MPHSPLLWLFASEAYLLSEERKMRLMASQAKHYLQKKKKKKESEEEKDSLKSIKTKIGYDYDWILSIIRFTYQVSIQTIKAVSCVWVMTRFGVLRANELHDLVLSFTRGLWWNGNQKNFTETHTRHKALKSSNSPHDQTNTRSLPAMICLWTVYCEQNI